MRLLDGSGVSREAHAPFCERLEVRFLRPTHPFHKILKSGCKAEDSQLRTASRLTNLIAIFCILAWRVFWLTEINRSVPDAPPEVSFTATEITLLDQLVKDTARTANAPPLSHSLIKLAQLGGYLARASDPPPGNKVIWRGMHRLIDIELGYWLGRKKGRRKSG